MIPVQTFVVKPVLPEPLAPLRDIVMNFWWCWNHHAIALLSSIDRELWQETRHNPVRVLATVSQDRLRLLAEDMTFLQQLRSVHNDFMLYMNNKGWYSPIDAHRGKYVAYFCAEFGLHESFPVYSGGLGVLAGDHIKASSDAALPLVGIGLLYQEGYFHQFLSQNGWQNERYTDLDFHELPLELLTVGSKPVVIDIDLPLGICYARIWKASVGRTPLYLLDTNIPENTNPVIRSITDRLYGGTTETRIMQEMVLGIGGMRALLAIGINPAVIHCNEGHAAFSMLERTRMNMERFSLTFQESWVITQSSSVFTTHTPVPAGNEVFSFELLKTYFETYVTTLGISWQEFCLLGSQREIVEDDGFSMTVLGLRGAFRRNGVSALHGDVARSMWKDVWEGLGEDEVPIRGLTNGIHTATWVAPELAEVYDTYLGAAWRTQPQAPEAWANVPDIPNIVLWNAHEHRRARLVLGARHHIANNHDLSLTQDMASHLDSILDPSVLTIGFARRFASYKRADLLLRDIDRLVLLITNPERPIQFVLAGKAHPRDTQGKELLASVIQRVRAKGLQHRIVFLEDYEMDIARQLVRGCDVWLNTPRRPYEASGTSGMKSVLNGGLHCSILDGWWAEAFDGANGFAIDKGEKLSNDEQDVADAQALYDIMEHRMVPMFYQRDNNGVPTEWVSMMKWSIQSLAPQFSAARMVRQYATEMYFNAFDAFAHVTQNGAQLSRTFLQYLNNVRSAWPSVTVRTVAASGNDEAHVGKRIELQASVELAGLNVSDVLVQAVYGRLDSHGDFIHATTTPLTCSSMHGTLALFEGRYSCNESGLHGHTIRIMPVHEVLNDPADAHLLTYANNIT